MNNNILNLDFSKNSNMQPIIYGRVGDQGLQTVTVNIFRNGVPADLTEGVLSFEGVTSRNQTKVFDSYNINSTEEGLKQGTFEYTFPSEAFSVTGKYEHAYFSITYGDSRDTTADFEIIVLENADIDVEEAETVITEYNKLIEELQELQDEYIEETDAKFASIQGRITNLENTIKNYEKEVNESKKEVLSTIDAALKEFQSSDFYTREEVDEIFSTRASLEKGALVFKNTYITSQDWNDIQDIGIYYCAGSSGENMPTSGPLYGYLTVKKITSITQQTFETGLSVYIRSLTGNPQTWSNWHEIALAEKTVSLSGDQEIDGVKIFLKTPMLNQIPVLVNNELPFEAWYGTGKELTNIPHKARLVIGDEVTTIGKQQNRAMRESPLVWNSGRWEAEVVRDCTLLIEGLARLQFGGSSSGKYAYLIFYRDDEETNQIGYAGGTGDSTNVLQWKHGIHFSRIFEAKAGSMFSIAYEGEESKTVDFAQINMLHIMEIES